MTIDDIDISQVAIRKPDIATPPIPHPAQVALACGGVSDHGAAVSCHYCHAKWDIPLNRYHEPDIQIFTIEILRCPTCGILDLCYPQPNPSNSI